ncbi:TetR/AcrR family transcriptional regulator [Gordonia sp. CPCC 205515]|uniref:TetR/AcrR family transcriptional regulator n=1 Tax=Gordonia sp. CPCC 205515 TaxID=3140791 RepID=UPI003AF3FAE4
MPQGRRYGGADAEERRMRRRADLVAAGLDLFGTDGYPAVSVKRVCDHAGLTQRYFYESFGDRAALLAAVYADCVAVARAATVAAATEWVGGREVAGISSDDASAVARATLGTFVQVLVDDPRRARVMLVEVVGVNEELEQIRLAAIHDWAELILTLALGERPPDRRQRLTAIGLVGAVTQLLVDWYTTTTADTADLFDPDAIVDVSVELFVAAYGRLLS